MSDSSPEAQDASVLGKRTWDNGNEGNGSADSEPAAKKPAVEDEESDDDVGPMPMPAGAAPTATKKKKKGKNLSGFQSDM